MYSFNICNNNTNNYYSYVNWLNEQIQEIKTNTARALIYKIADAYDKLNEQHKEMVSEFSIAVLFSVPTDVFKHYNRIYELEYILLYTCLNNDYKFQLWLTIQVMRDIMHFFKIIDGLDFKHRFELIAEILRKIASKESICNSWNNC